MASVIEWRKAAALWGAFFEGHSNNDLSFLCGLQWRLTLPLRCCFQIRPASATNARVWGSQALGHSCHTGELGLYCYSDRSGGWGGLRGESNRPLAPWHPPACRPLIPCGRRMIICMTEPGAFAASDYDSPWQQAFFSSLSHAPDNFMTGCPAQLQERVCGCIS